MCGVILCVVQAVVGAQICTVTIEVVSEYKRRGVMRDSREVETLRIKNTEAS